MLSHVRRKILHIAVTAHPTAEWTARQIIEAFPWDDAPTHLIRDNDTIFGAAFKKQLAAMGIRDGPTAFRSSGQSVPAKCKSDVINLPAVLIDHADYIIGIYNFIVFACAFTVINKFR